MTRRTERTAGVVEEAARASAPPLTIELVRRSDGGGHLRCTRADGSVTWQRQNGASAAFFPRHDLTHYAVEIALNFRSGFYGLISSGWDIADTEGKGPRGRLPAEAIAVEHIVGLLDVERATGAEWSADQFNEQSAAFARERGAAPPPLLDDDELRRVRTLRQELFTRWAACPPGATLQLTFPAADGAER